MAGPTKTQSQFIYVGLFGGKFVIRCNEDDPDPDKRQRKIKSGDTIWEIPYGKLEDMMLADVREAEHDQYGKSWEFIFMANNDYYLLRIMKSSPVASMILNRLENIILDQPVTLTAWMPDGEDKNVVTIWQNGEKIERAHTKENPNGLPQPKQVTVNNQLVWDWSEPLAFYSEMVKGLTPHMLGVDHNMQDVAKEQEVAPPPPKAGPAKNTPPPEDDTDDLPF